MKRPPEGYQTPFERATSFVESLKDQPDAELMWLFYKKIYYLRTNNGSEELEYILESIKPSELNYDVIKLVVSMCETMKPKNLKSFEQEAQKLEKKLTTKASKVLEPTNVHRINADEVGRSGNGTAGNK